MKEETNNNQIKGENNYDSKNSLLANKMGTEGQDNEEKQSTREEKDQNSRSNIKSDPNGDEFSFKGYDEVAEWCYILMLILVAY